MFSTFVRQVVDVFASPSFSYIFQEKPFVVKKEDNGYISYEGYCIDLIHELARNLKFTFEINPSPDGFFGAKTANGTWNGLIGELVNEVCENGHFIGLLPNHKLKAVPLLCVLFGQLILDQCSTWSFRTRKQTNKNQQRPFTEMPVDGERNGLIFFFSDICSS